MHHDCNVIIHVLVDIAQEAGSNDAHLAKRYACEIDILVALGVRHPASLDDHLIRRVVAGDAEDLLDPLQQRRAREFDGLGDVGHVGDVEFFRHDDANVVFGVGEELGDEDVVVSRVADAAADNAHREGEGGDGGDEVVRTDDCGHDGGGDDDAAYAEAGEDEQASHLVQVVGRADRQAPATGRHEHRGGNHVLLVMAAEDAEKPQDDAGSGRMEEPMGMPRTPTPTGPWP